MLGTKKEYFWEDAEKPGLYRRLVESVPAE